MKNDLRIAQLGGSQPEMSQHPLPIKPSATQAAPMTMPAKLAGHRAVLISDAVFMRLQALQKTPAYFVVDGTRHELGASIDLRLIATALVNLALNNEELCRAAHADALFTLRHQLSQTSCSPTTTHRE